MTQKGALAAAHCARVCFSHQSPAKGWINAASRGFDPTTANACFQQDVAEGNTEPAWQAPILRINPL